MTFTYGPGSELRPCPLWSLPPPSLEAFPKKRAGSEVPIPTAWQLGTLYGNMPGALREGKGPGLAQLILPLQGGSWGWEAARVSLWGRDGYVSLPPSPCCVRQRTSCR